MTSSPGESTSLRTTRPDDDRAGEAAVLAADRADLEERLAAVNRNRRLHALWTVLGISPAAAIPALGLLRDGSAGLLLVLLVLVTVFQGWAWARASRESQDLEVRLQAMDDS